MLPALLITAALSPAWAQDAAPLAPYTPPATAAPLAPLTGTDTPADPPLGNVRARSDTASNSSAADTRSPIAPVLPTPEVSAETPQAFLTAARTALAANHTGEAQEALERAESRALDRDVAPSAAGDAIDGPLIRQINAARQALSVGNVPAARQAIDAALAGG